MGRKLLASVLGGALIAGIAAYEALRCRTPYYSNQDFDGIAERFASAVKKEGGIDQLKFSHALYRMSFGESDSEMVQRWELGRAKKPSIEYGLANTNCGRVKITKLEGGAGGQPAYSVRIPAWRAEDFVEQSERERRRAN